MLTGASKPPEQAPGGADSMHNYTSYSRTLVPKTVVGMDFGTLPKMLYIFGETCTYIYIYTRQIHICMYTYIYMHI